jgi:hypothetical protein
MVGIYGPLAVSLTSMMHMNVHVMLVNTWQQGTKEVRSVVSSSWKEMTYRRIHPGQ